MCYLFYEDALSRRQYNQHANIIIIQMSIHMKSKQNQRKHDNIPISTTIGVK